MQDWDYANAEIRQPVKNRRSIVSVPFQPKELDVMAQKARAEGKSLSRYIHDQAMHGVSLPTIHLLVDGESVVIQSTT